MSDKTNPLLVTMALPYANGDIHLGHMVEAVQTDIFVRAQKMTGRETVYICADDTHGTPIQLNAMKQGITPEELIATFWDNHTRDYQSFGIGFDKYYTTNSEENRQWAEKIYGSLVEGGLIKKKTIEQYYCEHDKRFLPDRFVQGTCPKCGAEDQYGDNCEKCGATYNAEELSSAACVLCGNGPELRETEHFFITMEKKEAYLTEYLNSGEVIQNDMKSFVMNWVKDPQERCISRDAPYFGFKIPGTEDKYFYVWLDAPVGYVSSTDKWCQETGRDMMDYWGEDAPGDVVHVIGKDIVYFHTMLWPVMLHTVGLKQPSRIIIHGFLTVEGEKMSKSRGTFILAKDYVDRVTHDDAAQFLRLYYASKLADNSNDLDFNIDEFINKVNTTLVNNIGNFTNRSFTFLQKFFDGTAPTCDWDSAMADAAATSLASVQEKLIAVNFRSALDEIHAFGSLCNKYFQDNEPWKLVKLDDKSEAERVMVTCVNMVKTLGTMLKPIVPEIAARIEAMFDAEFSWESGLFSVKGQRFGEPQKLALPLEAEHFDELYAAEEPAKVEPEEELIEFPDFLKLKMRVGEVTACEKIKKSKKLLKLQVNDGYKTRQIISGLAMSYEPEQLVGKKVCFVSNLKPAKLMGQLSEGMILAAENDEGELAVVTVDKDFEAGSTVA